MGKAKRRPLAQEPDRKRYLLAGIHSTTPAPPDERDRSFDQEIVARVMEDDRKWFAARPGALYRIRQHVPGEMPSLYRATLVRYLGPNNRARLGIMVGCRTILRLHAEGAALYDYDDKEIIAVPWDEVPMTDEPLWEGV